MTQADSNTTTSELKLIAPRRNFLIRALGFTAAGAILPIGIVAAEDARARIVHHQAELEKAWRDYYGTPNVRAYEDVRAPDATYFSHGQDWPAISSFVISASVQSGKMADWVVDAHAWKCQQPGKLAVEALQRSIDRQMAKSIA